MTTDFFTSDYYTPDTKLSVLTHSTASAYHHDSINLLSGVLAIYQQFRQRVTSSGSALSLLPLFESYYPWFFTCSLLPPTKTLVRPASFAFTSIGHISPRTRTRCQSRLRHTGLGPWMAKFTLGGGSVPVRTWAWACENMLQLLPSVA